MISLPPLYTIQQSSSKIYLLTHRCDHAAVPAVKHLLLGWLKIFFWSSADLPVHPHLSASHTLACHSGSMPCSLITRPSSTCCNHSTYLSYFSSIIHFKAFKALEYLSLHWAHITLHYFRGTAPEVQCIAVPIPTFLLIGHEISGN